MQVELEPIISYQLCSVYQECSLEGKNKNLFLNPFIKFAADGSFIKAVSPSTGSPAGGYWSYCSFFVHKPIQCPISCKAASG